MSDKNDDFESAYPAYDSYGIIPAIDRLIADIQKAQKKRREEIEKSANCVHEDEWGNNSHTELLYALTYDDAADSHAILGALAPTIEAIIKQEFRFLGYIYQGREARIKVDTEHHRWKLFHADQEKFWDVQVFCQNGEAQAKPNLLAGFNQSIRALALASYFGPINMSYIDALFSYRNKCFHNGYEWPKNERLKFEAMTVEKGWKSWFDCSRSGGDPWIFYMTDSFIEACQTICSELISAFDRIKKDWMDDGLTQEERSHLYSAWIESRKSNES